MNKLYLIIGSILISPVVFLILWAMKESREFRMELFAFLFGVATFIGILFLLAGFLTQ